jgi:hypothetical protein
MEENFTTEADVRDLLQQRTQLEGVIKTLKERVTELVVERVALVIHVYDVVEDKQHRNILEEELMALLGHAHHAQAAETKED